MSKSLLITHANVATWEGNEFQIKPNRTINIRNGIILTIAPTQEGRDPLDSGHGLVLSQFEKQGNEVVEVLDAKGQLVLPGSICSHTHFYGAFARGLSIPGDAPKDFPEILEKLWWKLDKALTPEDVRYSALVCLVDAVKHGTTTLFDHHASPNAIDGSLDIIAEAVEQAGLRACLCYEVSDRDGPARAQAGIFENVRFAKKLAANSKLQVIDSQLPLTTYQLPPGPLVASTFGLHA